MLHLFDGAAWVNIGPGVAGGGGSSGGTFVGTSPPANPVSGTTWWNGTVFQVWDGSAWKAVGPPGTAPGSQLTAITFAIAQPAALSFTAATWLVMPFTTTPQVDTMAAYDPVTHRYTPTRPGVYQFEARAAMAATCGLAILKNDPGVFTNSSSDIIVGIATIGGSPVSTWINATGFAQMNGTTDYVRLWTYQTTGALGAQGSSPLFSSALMP